ncbi:MAG: hypothetical protein WC527_08455 [Candidatus Margulisiibacteriota bacterium]
MADITVENRTSANSGLQQQMTTVKRDGEAAKAIDRALGAGMKAAEAVSYLRYVPPVGFIFLLGGCTPTNKELCSLRSLVEQQNSFNGADYSGILDSGIELEARSGDRDPGISLILSKYIAGKLEFTYQKGEQKEIAGNSVTIQFIKAVSARAYNRDKMLSQVEFTPSDEPKKASFDIPEGTNKIVVMKVGSGGVDAKMTEITIVPKLTK